jgi:hypothetical protein
MKTIEEILLEARQVTIDRSEDIWKKSIFHFLLPFSSDERGRFGEYYFSRIAQEYTDFSVIWDGDSNTEADDGIYDMTINYLRNEIKTAMKGTKSDTWQHDVIKEVDDYDRLTFLDMTPDNKIYITVIKNTEMVYGTRHPIFEKKSTSCKGGWKFDMSNSTLAKGLYNGMTYLHNTENPNYEKLSEFLVKKF